GKHVCALVAGGESIIDGQSQGRVRIGAAERYRAGVARGNIAATIQGSHGESKRVTGDYYIGLRAKAKLGDRRSGGLGDAEWRGEDVAGPDRDVGGVLGRLRPTGRWCLADAVRPGGEVEERIVAVV